MFSSGKYDHAADCFQLVATHTQRTPLSSSSSSSTVAAADARSQLAWSRLGAALTNADQHEQAMSAYQTISSLSPVLSLRTAFNMAVLHVRADRHEDAMKLLLDSLMASRQEMKRLGVKNNDASDRGALLIRGEDDVWGLVDSIASVYCKSLGEGGLRCVKREILYFLSPSTKCNGLNGRRLYLNAI